MVRLNTAPARAAAGSGSQVSLTSSAGVVIRKPMASLPGGRRISMLQPGACAWFSTTGPLKPSRLAKCTANSGISKRPGVWANSANS